MKKLLLLIPLILQILPLSAQTDLFYPFHLIPDSLLVNADEVVREESTVFQVESLRAGSLSYRKVVTILNDRSHANREQVYYDSESKIRRFQANVYDAAGSLIRKVDKEEIKDLSAVDGFSIYQDNRVQVLDIRHSQYPYTVEFEYEMRLAGSHFCTYPNWYIQDFGTSVERGQLVFDLPAGLSFHHQVLNIDLQPEKVADRGRDVYTWRVSNRKAPRSESYMPPLMQILPQVMTSPDIFVWDKYQGSMASWQAYGQFMNELYAGRDALPEEALQKAQQLVAGAGNTAEKIQRLYHYLQENMRYVSVQLGIGGWQPFDAAYVNEKRYGDCKALSNYMKAMLKAVDIEAYPALIYSGNLRYEVQDNFTFPRFNHVILYLPGEDVWLECTSDSYPAGYIGYSNSNRNAMLVTPAGGRLKKTPIYKAEDNTEAHRAKVVLDAEGQAGLQVESRFSGADHEIYRSLKTYRSEEDQRKWLLEKQNNAGFKLVQYRLSCESDQPVSQLGYSATVARFAQKAGKRLFVPVKPVSAPVNVPPKNDRRLYPIHIPASYTEQDTVVVLFPEGYEVESAPAPAPELETEFGKFRYEITIEESQITYVRSLHVFAGQFPALKYGDYYNFYRAISTADSGQVVLKRTE